MKLHAQLGLAMAYYQESEIGLRSSDQGPFLALAADYWQAVMETAQREDVVIANISDHWLWSEQALADWNEARTKIETHLSQVN
ncbi:MAG: hypothetical protein F6K11_34055 [Leptolyngbya sp. SIO3F4]|nr:hypothetical protein [Leptolyngbya sp. SIO3F4]